MGEVFQATARPGFRMLLGRENPRLTRDQIDHIYDASGYWATKSSSSSCRASPPPPGHPPARRRVRDPVVVAHLEYSGLPRDASQLEALRDTAYTSISTWLSLGTRISRPSTEERRAVHIRV